jgi:ribonuclease VapC
MVIDTSALLAILQDEPERASFIDAIDNAERRCLSAASLVEVSIVIEARYGEGGVRDLDRFLERAEVEIEPLTAAQARAARLAWSRFGKGRHRAALNLGHCFAYALAKARAEPLLYKGGDFALTDVSAAL